ncbi:MAG: DinB family protein [Bacteroidetes bacterium]|nr:DinB family protein [Bacteroidota bacterium]
MNDEIPPIRLLKSGDPERWQMGALAGFPSLLQPVVHALLQARDEINTLLQTGDDRLLWQRPAELAAPAFHLQHIKGFLDRLFTYAEGKMLSTAQLAYLSAEGVMNNSTRAELLKDLNDQFLACFRRLAIAPVKELYNERLVGRKKIPSTMLGLYFHAAEHTMRHTGQLLTTWKILCATH